MTALYPPLVDVVNTTNGDLPESPNLVDYGPMLVRPDYTQIGKRLEAVRLGFSSLSQRAWAEKNGFNPTQYNNWEKGHRRISVDAAEVLARKYGLTLDYLFLGRVDGLSEKASNVL